MCVKSTRVSLIFLTIKVKGNLCVTIGPKIIEISDGLVSGQTAVVSMSASSKLKVITGHKTKCIVEVRVTRPMRIEVGLSLEKSVVQVLSTSV